MATTRNYRNYPGYSGYSPGYSSVVVNNSSSTTSLRTKGLGLATIIAIAFAAITGGAALPILASIFAGLGTIASGTRDLDNGPKTTTSLSSLGTSVYPYDDDPYWRDRGEKKKTKKPPSAARSSPDSQQNKDLIKQMREAREADRKAAEERYKKLQDDRAADKQAADVRFAALQAALAARPPAAHAAPPVPPPVVAHAAPPVGPPPPGAHAAPPVGGAHAAPPVGPPVGAPPVLGPGGAGPAVLPAGALDPAAAARMREELMAARVQAAWRRHQLAVQRGEHDLAIAQERAAAAIQQAGRRAAHEDALRELRGHMRELQARAAHDARVALDDARRVRLAAADEARLANRELAFLRRRFDGVQGDVRGLEAREQLLLRRLELAKMRWNTDVSRRDRQIDEMSRLIGRLRGERRGFDAFRGGLDAHDEEARRRGRGRGRAVGRGDHDDEEDTSAELGRVRRQLENAREEAKQALDGKHAAELRAAVLDGEKADLEGRIGILTMQIAMLGGGDAGVDAMRGAQREREGDVRRIAQLQAQKEAADAALERVQERLDALRDQMGEMLSPVETARLRAELQAAAQRAQRAEDALEVQQQLARDAAAAKARAEAEKAAVDADVVRLQAEVAAAEARGEAANALVTGQLEAAKELAEERKLALDAARDAARDAAQAAARLEEQKNHAEQEARRLQRENDQLGARADASGELQQARLDAVAKERDRALKRAEELAAQVAADAADKAAALREVEQARIELARLREKGVADEDLKAHLQEMLEQARAAQVEAVQAQAHAAEELAGAKKDLGVVQGEKGALQADVEQLRQRMDDLQKELAEASSHKGRAALAEEEIRNVRDYYEAEMLRIKEAYESRKAVYENQIKYLKSLVDRGGLGGGSRAVGVGGRAADPVGVEPDRVAGVLSARLEDFASRLRRAEEQERAARDRAEVAERDADEAKQAARQAEIAAQAARRSATTDATAQERALTQANRRAVEAQRKAERLAAEAAEAGQLRAQLAEVTALAQQKAQEAEAASRRIAQAEREKEDALRAAREAEERAVRAQQAADKAGADEDGVLAQAQLEARQARNEAGALQEEIDSIREKFAKDAAAIRAELEARAARVAKELVAEKEAMQLQLDRMREALHKAYLGIDGQRKANHNKAEALRGELEAQAEEMQRALKAQAEEAARARRAVEEAMQERGVGDDGSAVAALNAEHKQLQAAYERAEKRMQPAIDRLLEAAAEIEKRSQALRVGSGEEDAYEQVSCQMKEAIPKVEETLEVAIKAKALARQVAEEEDAERARVEAGGDENPDFVAPSKAALGSQMARFAATGTTEVPGAEDVDTLEGFIAEKREQRKGMATVLDNAERKAREGHEALSDVMEAARLDAQATKNAEAIAGLEEELARSNAGAEQVAKELAAKAEALAEEVARLREKEREELVARQDEEAQRNAELESRLGKLQRVRGSEAEAARIRKQLDHSLAEPLATLATKKAQVQAAHKGLLAANAAVSRGGDDHSAISAAKRKLDKAVADEQEAQKAVDERQKERLALLERHARENAMHAQAYADEVARVRKRDKASLAAQKIAEEARTLELQKRGDEIGTPSTDGGNGELAAAEEAASLATAARKEKQAAIADIEEKHRAEVQAEIEANGGKENSDNAEQRRQELHAAYEDLEAIEQERLAAEEEVQRLNREKARIAKEFTVQNQLFGDVAKLEAEEVEVGELHAALVQAQHDFAESDGLDSSAVLEAKAQFDAAVAKADATRKKVDAHRKAKLKLLNEQAQEDEVRIRGLEDQLRDANAALREQGRQIDGVGGKAQRLVEQLQAAQKAKDEAEEKLRSAARVAQAALEAAKRASGEKEGDDLSRRASAVGSRTGRGVGVTADDAPELDGILEALRAQVDKLSGANEEAAEQLAQAQRDLETARKDAEAARRDAQLQSEEAARVPGLERQLSALDRLKRELADEKERSRNALGRAEASEQAKGDLEAQLSALRKAQEEAADVGEEVGKLRNALAQAKTSLQVQMRKAQGLQGKLEEAQRELPTARKAVAAARKEAEALKQTVARLDGETKGLREQNAQFEKAKKRIDAYGTVHYKRIWGEDASFSYQGVGRSRRVFNLTTYEGKVEFIIEHAEGARAMQTERDQMRRAVDNLEAQARKSDALELELAKAKKALQEAESVAQAAADAKRFVDDRGGVDRLREQLGSAAGLDGLNRQYREALERQRAAEERAQREEIKYGLARRKIDQQSAQIEQLQEALAKLTGREREWHATLRSIKAATHDHERQAIKAPSASNREHFNVQAAIAQIQARIPSSGNKTPGGILAVVRAVQEADARAKAAAEEEASRSRSVAARRTASKSTRRGGSRGRKGAGSSAPKRKAGSKAASKKVNHGQGSVGEFVLKSYSDGQREEIAEALESMIEVARPVTAMLSPQGGRPHRSDLMSAHGDLDDDVAAIAPDQAYAQILRLRNVNKHSEDFTAYPNNEEGVLAYIQVAVSAPRGGGASPVITYIADTMTPADRDALQTYLRGLIAAITQPPPSRSSRTGVPALKVPTAASTDDIKDDGDTRAGGDVSKAIQAIVAECSANGGDNLDSPGEILAHIMAVRDSMPDASGRLPHRPISAPVKGAGGYLEGLIREGSLIKEVESALRERAKAAQSHSSGLRMYDSGNKLSDAEAQRRYEEAIAKQRAEEEARLAKLAAARRAAQEGRSASRSAHSRRTRPLSAGSKRVSYKMIPQGMPSSYGDTPSHGGGMLPGIPGVADTEMMGPMVSKKPLTPRHVDGRKTPRPPSANPTTVHGASYYPAMDTYAMGQSFRGKPEGKKDSMVVKDGDRPVTSGRPASASQQRSFGIHLRRGSSVGVAATMAMVSGAFPAGKVLHQPKHPGPKDGPTDAQIATSAAGGVKGFLSRLGRRGTSSVRPYTPGLRPEDVESIHELSEGEDLVPPHNPTGRRASMPPTSAWASSNSLLR